MQPRTLTWIGVALGAVAAASLVFLAIFAVTRPSSPQGAVPSSITVSGEGMASAAPDLAHVSLGVDTPARSASEAEDANASAMSAVINAIKGLGVVDKDIRTSGFSVEPIYAQNRPGEAATPTITGYRVRNTITVTVQEVRQVGAILDAGLKAGANSATQVTFDLKDNTSLQQQALSDAVKQARSKAQSIASAAGLTLTGAYTISEQNVQPPRPLAQPAVAAASAAGTPIQSGELTATAQVQMVFRYR